MANRYSLQMPLRFDVKRRVRNIRTSVHTSTLRTWRMLPDFDLYLLKFNALTCGDVAL